MAKHKTHNQVQFKPHTPSTRALLEPDLVGQSALYRIKKFGLYRYVMVRFNPETGEEKPIGPENVYGVVASEMVDLIFKDIHPDSK